ncbi:hypothetical protein CALVIDRAFT_27443 [Calocera viscosa TUFC12733]|uniref:Uncharacterized protein n=1 Tax=Calocera viscosa (strain TUFC12733) TaxID=1330018 RepID=A0A167P9P7_CALVF|nr:hypothetical protein CALVIDRAFT_27443 [Calocera viscosa TUFC12733]
MGSQDIIRWWELCEVDTSARLANLPVNWEPREECLPGPRQRRFSWFLSRPRLRSGSGPMLLACLVHHTFPLCTLRTGTVALGAYPSLNCCQTPGAHGPEHSGPRLDFSYPGFFSQQPAVSPYWGYQVPNAPDHDNTALGPGAWSQKGPAPIHK